MDFQTQADAIETLSKATDTIRFATSDLYNLLAKIGEHPAAQHLRDAIHSLDSAVDSIESAQGEVEGVLPANAPEV